MKPKFAVDAMVATVGQALPRGPVDCLRPRALWSGHAALAQSVEHLTRNEKVGVRFPRRLHLIYPDIGGEASNASSRRYPLCTLAR